MLNTVRKLILGLFAFGVVYAGAIQPVDAALQSRPLAKDHFRTPGDNVDGDESGFLTPHPEIFPM